MDTKLTLKLDEETIEMAKRYARQQNTSLSMLIENYLQALTQKDDPNFRITPLVKSLSGILDLPEDYDHRKEYGEYLVNKYK